MSSSSLICKFFPWSFNFNYYVFFLGTLFTKQKQTNRYRKQTCSYQSESESHSVVSDSLWPHGLYSSWNFLDQDTGGDSLSLLQGIFPTQGVNPGLLRCRRMLIPAEPEAKPKNTGVGSLSLLQWIFLPPEFEPGSPALQVDSLPAEPWGKPKKTGVGSLSLLQWIFLTQESTGFPAL